MYRKVHYILRLLLNIMCQFCCRLFAENKNCDYVNTDSARDSASKEFHTVKDLKGAKGSFRVKTNNLFNSLETPFI
jgi:hypothetical protein